MRVAVTGSSGFIGSALCADLAASGVHLTRLVRRPPRVEGEVAWDPERGELPAEALRGVDAVVHLAGEPVGERRWSPEQKRRIHDSRVGGTRLVAETIAKLDDGPGVLVSASASGYYGDRGDEELTEDSPPGEGFFPEMVRAWEAATEPARQAGVRVVLFRPHLVLDPDGGALGRMLPPFRLGLGGRISSGRQWWSWVAREDLVGIIRFALERDDLTGPVNACTPTAVTNAEFTKVLGRVLRRPTVMPVPRPMVPLAVTGAQVLSLLSGRLRGLSLRELPSVLVLGRELAAELLLVSARMRPAKLEAFGYEFAQPELEPALRSLLGRSG